jgi:hypothetical protein
MQRLFALLFSAAIAVAAPLAASAQIPPGTQLVGTLGQSIDSKNAQPGQPFEIDNAHTTDYNINGATIYGHVASVQHAGQGTPGKIRLSVDKVNTRSGNVYEVEGYASNVVVQTKSNTLKELGGAAAGALVGGLLGHGVGALIGAGAGALYAKNNRQNVTIPQGSQVTIQVVRMRRQPN